MFQQLIALFIIAFFLFRLFWQRRQKEITGNEFLFWLFFWSLAGLAMMFIRHIDSLVQRIGFSASGIEVLLYLAVAVLFYLVFRLRLRCEKNEKLISRIVRDIAIRDNKENKN